MTTLQTIILYYLIIIITTLIVLKSEMLDSKKSNKRRILFGLSMLIPIIVAGFRYGIGVDYFNYKGIYGYLTNSGELVKSRLEPSWILLNYIVKILFDNVVFVYIISASLIVINSFIAIYRHRSNINISIAVLIFMTTMYFPSFNLIRLSIAASIIMLSIKPIQDKKPLQYVITVLIASSFHYTSLIFLPAYWLINNIKGKHLKWKKIIVLLVPILCIVFANQLISFISSFSMFSGYSYYKLEFSEIGVGFIIMKLPIISIIILNYQKLKKYNNFYYKLVLLYFIGIILGFTGYFGEYIDRISIYYEIVQIFTLSAIIHVQKDKRIRNYHYIYMTLYFIGWFTYKIVVFNAHKTVPYNWIF